MEGHEQGDHGAGVSYFTLHRDIIVLITYPQLIDQTGASVTNKGKDLVIPISDTADSRSCRRHLL